MNILELSDLIKNDFQKAKAAIISTKGESKAADYLKQYEIEGHDIFDQTKRQDKTVTKSDGSTKVEAVARIGIPLQKLITQRAAAFLCANPILLSATPEANEEKLLEAIQKVWEDNKLDYKSMEIAEKLFSETEVAELWYTEPLLEDNEYWAGVGINAKFKLRFRLLSKSLGDELYPVFDGAGDMIAFARGYFVKEGDKSIEHFDIYTEKVIYKGVKGEGGFEMLPEPNIVGKIPVIYYSQDKPEWNDVQTMIDRLEKKASNHADTNDYFDSPIVFIEGELTDMAEKGDTGKVLIGTQGSKAYYLSWDHAPESTKMEIENLLRFIYSCTDTPDISFENLKGLGTTSGFALEMMFMGAHLKAARKAGVFGESVQRRINYIKAALAVLDLGLKQSLKLSVKPVFNFFLPKDVEGTINTLTTAVTGGIMSKLTAVKNNPYIKDAEEEVTQMDKEKSEQETSPTGLNQLMNDAA